MKHRIMFAAALAVLAVSCSKNNSPELDGSCREIRVSPRVEWTTKGSYTTETLEDFDLYIENPRNSRYSYTNTRFTKNADGGWLSEKQMLWERPAGQLQNVKLLALAPAQQTGGHSLNDSPIVDVEVEKVQSADSRKSDLLYTCLGDDDLSWEDRFTDDGALDLGLQHAMALFRIEISLGTEFNRNGVPEQNPVTELKVDRTVIKGTFQQESDGGYLVRPASVPAETVYAYEKEWNKADDATDRCTAVFECILVPQDGVQPTVSFLVDGIPYKWTSGENEHFYMGQCRTLKLNVGKDVLSAGTMTSRSWADGGNEYFETE